jgi:DNA modification methylase
MFFGSGTTGMVAINQNKNYVGIELNPDYIKIAEKRINKVIHHQTDLEDLF